MVVQEQSKKLVKSRAGEMAQKLEANIAPSKNLIPSTQVDWLTVLLYFHLQGDSSDVLFWSLPILHKCVHRHSNNQKLKTKQENFQQIMVSRSTNDQQWHDNQKQPFHFQKRLETLTIELKANSEAGFFQPPTSSLYRAGSCSRCKTIALHGKMSDCEKMRLRIYTVCHLMIITGEGM